MRSIATRISADGNCVANSNRPGGYTAASHHDDILASDDPLRHLAFGIDIHEILDMGVAKSHLGDRAGHRYKLVCVKFGRERVVPIGTCTANQ